jgi:hypothetical protein
VCRGFREDESAILPILSEGYHKIEELSIPSAFASQSYEIYYNSLLFASSVSCGSVKVFQQVSPISVTSNFREDESKGVVIASFSDSGEIRHSSGTFA